MISFLVILSIAFSNSEVCSVEESSCSVPKPKLHYEGKIPIWETSFGGIDISPRDKTPLLINHEIVDLVDGEHFDFLMQNLYEESRVAALILFWNSSDATCVDRVKRMSPKYERSEITGPPSELMLTMFDMSSRSQRLWYPLTPERDLIGRFDVVECPSLVYAPRSCHGQTDWCVKQRISETTIEIGCDDFQDSCPTYESMYLSESNVSHWGSWLTNQQRLYGLPPKPLKNSEYEAYIERTQTTVLRNSFMPPHTPKFSKQGFKVMDIPSDFYQEIRKFYYQFLHTRYF
jgi:hypothetical protein